MKGKLCQKTIDVYTKLFNDSNSKVQLQALRVFDQLTQNVPELVENNITIVMQSIYNALASNRLEVKGMAENMLNGFTLNLDTLSILVPLCRGADYGLTKARPFFINQLTCIIYIFYEQR